MPPLDDSYSFRSIPRRPPQVPHVSFPPSTCHFYYKRFRVVIGLRLVLQPYPRLQPVNDFCSSGQRFALGLVGSPNPASFRFHLTMDTLAFGYVLPTTGRTPDLHRLETCAAGRTTEKSLYSANCETQGLFMKGVTEYWISRCKELPASSDKHSEPLHWLPTVQTVLPHAPCSSETATGNEPRWQGSPDNRP